jgi:hypothetical protein
MVSDAEDAEQFTVGFSYSRELGVMLRHEDLYSNDLLGYGTCAGNDVFLGGAWAWTLVKVGEEWFGHVGGLTEVEGAQEELGPFKSDADALSAIADRLLAYLVHVTGQSSYTTGHIPLWKRATNEPRER